MRVFVAGGTGVIGRRLVPQLVTRGHQVTATTTTAGKAPLWAGGVIGAQNVARVLASTFPWFVRIEGTLEPHEVKGQPGAIFRDQDNHVLNTWTLDVLDGQIQTIRTVINPDKLGHLGPVADAWAVIREANQARRANG